MHTGSILESLVSRMPPVFILVVNAIATFSNVLRDHWRSIYERGKETRQFITVVAAPLKLSCCATWLFRPKRAIRLDWKRRNKLVMLLYREFVAPQFYNQNQVSPESDQHSGRDDFHLYHFLWLNLVLVLFC